jgi:cell division protein FtsB|nr:septum formation initiator family protein [Actinacidiphila soli]
MTPRRPGATTAARSPFVLLIVLLLAGGLFTLLLLNSAVVQDSFQLNDLQKQTTQLTDEEQGLQQEVDGYSAPDALDKRARELGMVPGGNPAFLAPDGTVRGQADAATTEPLPEPSVTPTPTPSATVTPTLTVTPTPTATPSVTATVAVTPSASAQISAAASVQTTTRSNG